MLCDFLFQNHFEKSKDRNRLFNDDYFRVNYNDFFYDDYFSDKFNNLRRQLKLNR